MCCEGGRESDSEGDEENRDEEHHHPRRTNKKNKNAHTDDESARMLIGCSGRMCAHVCVRVPYIPLYDFIPLLLCRLKM